MRAAFIEQPCPADQIQVGELPTPAPKAKEVLVKVAVSALNPVDLYIRSGTIAMELPKPFVPGCDLAGTVEAVGPEVSRFLVGDRVWGSNQGLLGRQGTMAEYACVEEGWLYRTPESVSDKDAAATSLVGITAHLGLFHCAKLQAGETLFVNGGTGGVGSMVVQMAKAIGAKTIATVGTDEKVELCKAWGCDLVINYKSDDVDEAIRNFTDGEGVHVWYETQREPNFMRTVGLLRDRGRMVIMAGRTAEPTFPVGPFYVKGLSLFGFAMFKFTQDEQRECADDINKWASNGKLRIPVGRTFPLEEAAQSHKFLEENTLGSAGQLIGKVVVEV
ncbi:MAG: zinc-binding alcohol dehydrogenase family protein [Gemmataceae bacterium]